MLSSSSSDPQLGSPLTSPGLDEPKGRTSKGVTLIELYPNVRKHRLRQRNSPTPTHTFYHLFSTGVNNLPDHPSQEESRCVHTVLSVFLRFLRSHHPSQENPRGLLRGHMNVASWRFLNALRVVCELNVLQDHMVSKVDTDIM